LDRKQLHGTALAFKFCGQNANARTPQHYATASLNDETAIITKNG